jgi:hypothetical protein
MKGRSMKRENRVRMYFIDPQHLLQMFTKEPEGYHCAFKRGRIADFPQDAEVEGVHYDPSRRAFCLTVYHPTFDVVPDGEMIPFEPGFHEMELECLSPVEIGGKRYWTFDPPVVVKTVEERIRFEINRLSVLPSDVIIVKYPEDTKLEQLNELIAAAESVHKELMEKHIKATILVVPQNFVLSKASKEETREIVYAWSEMQVYGQEPLTENIIFYPATDPQGAACLIAFDAEELAAHPELATDHNARNQYLAVTKRLFNSPAENLDVKKAKKPLSVKDVFEHPSKYGISDDDICLECGQPDIDAFMKVLVNEP